MNEDDYHEPVGELSETARDYHRALTSLKEEIEAVDWYHQRVMTCTDDALRPILAHNRNEEIEHAAMMLEWLRRHVSEWDSMLTRYLFTEEPIVALESRRTRSSGSLEIGALAPDEPAGTSEENR